MNGFERLLGVLFFSDCGLHVIEIGFSGVSVSSVICTPFYDISVCQFLLTKARCVVLNFPESNFRLKCNTSLGVHIVS